MLSSVTLRSAEVSCQIEKAWTGYLIYWISGPGASVYTGYPAGQMSGPGASVYTGYPAGQMSGLVRIFGQSQPDAGYPSNEFNVLPDTPNIP